MAPFSSARSVLALSTLGAAACFVVASASCAGRIVTPRDGGSDNMNAPAPNGGDSTGATIADAGSTGAATSSAETCGPQSGAIADSCTRSLHDIMIGDLVSAPNGDIVLAGTAVAQLVDLGDGVTLPPADPNGGGPDLVFARFDGSCTPIAARRFSGPPQGNRYATHVASNASGAIYVTGHYSEGIDLGIVSWAAAGDYRELIMKTSPCGAPIWAQRFDLGFFPAAIAPLASGAGVVAAGTAPALVDGSSDQDAVIMKFTDDGTVAWTLRLTGGPGQTAAAATASALPNGNVVVGGIAGATVTIDGRVLTFTGITKQGSWLAEIDAAGSVVNVAQYNDLQLTRFALAPDGTRYLAGNFWTQGVWGQLVAQLSSDAKSFAWTHLLAHENGATEADFSAIAARNDGVGAAFLCNGSGSIDLGGGNTCLNATQVFMQLAADGGGATFVTSDYGTDASAPAQPMQIWGPVALTPDGHFILSGNDNVGNSTLEKLLR
jgi:hypothetical protein